MVEWNRQTQDRVKPDLPSVGALKAHLTPRPPAVQHPGCDERGDRGVHLGHPDIFVEEERILKSWTAQKFK